jgi:hypothetical protein
MLCVFIYIYIHTYIFINVRTNSTIVISQFMMRFLAVYFACVAVNAPRLLVKKGRLFIYCETLGVA